jgi:hypothetical protein
VTSFAFSINVFPLVVVIESTKIILSFTESALGVEVTDAFNPHYQAVLCGLCAICDEQFTLLTAKRATS